MALLSLASLAGCGSEEVVRTASRSAPPTTSIDRPASSSTTSPDPEPAESRRGVEAGPADTTTSTVVADPLDVGCRSVADLDDEDELRRWSVVNDGVMGGRSSAEATADDSVLAIDGEIVTDGGGFSSIRLALAEPLGDDVSRLVVRLRTDGRAYELTVSDAAPDRDRRVSHQAPILAAGSGDWEVVEVMFGDLEASIFGRPVDVDPFEPGAAVEVGIILADGSDGPFHLELDWIRACP